MYNEEKDKLIKLFEFQQDNSSLLCSIFSYDGGKPKIGFSKSYTKKDGTIGYSNGRLSVNELAFIKENIDEMIKIMIENDKKNT